MAEKAFSDLKVVEVGDFIAAPFCSKMLADGGAEVIKVEEPRVGDESRRHGPFPNDEANPEKSGLFLILNTNKKSITLDIKKPQGRKMLKSLLKDADVFIIDKQPKALKELGLDYASLKDEFPRLIVTSITPWGLTGPYRDFKGYALNESAAGYVSSCAGMVGREPLDHPMSFSDYFGGMAGVAAAEYALFARDKTGKGQLCDVASFQAVYDYAGYRSVSAPIDLYKMLGFPIPGRFGEHMSPPGSPGRSWPAALFSCKDGDVWMYTIDGNHLVRLFELLGNPEWSKDPKYKVENPSLLHYETEKYHDELDAHIGPELKKRTKQELFDGFLKLGMPFCPVMTIEDLIKSPQSKARNDYIEVEHPAVGKLTYPAHPALLSETPWKIDRPAPLLGQHNEEIYCKKLGYSRNDLLELERAGII